MKTIRLFVSTLCTLLLCGSLAAQNTFRVPRLEEATEPVKASMTLPGHPRLLWLKGEEKALQQQLKKHPAWEALHQQILGEADRLLGVAPSERNMLGRRLLSVSREVERRIFYLGYAWRMTGEKRYAARAEAEMLKVASFSDWNPSHFLDVGEMSLALAVGYDWCYDYLSAASRATIEEALLEKGLKPAVDTEGPPLLHPNWWITTENNWNQVCNAGLLHAALALWDTRAETVVPYINRALASIPKAMAEYAPDGAYPEGPGYWEYGTTFNALFLDALQKAFNSDFGLMKAPGFLKTGLYSQQMITPALYQFNYYDNPARSAFTPVVFWFYAQTGDPALLYQQKRLLEQDTERSYLDNRVFVLTMLWGAAHGAPLDKPVVPTECFYTAGGRTPVAVMRSSWDDPKGAYLGFKAGSPGDNHAHMDVGEFIFESGGVRWAMDFGTENYYRLESHGLDIWTRTQNSQRWDVYRYRNQVHNVPTFNDRLQNMDSTTVIADYGQRDGWMFAAADLSALYRPQVDRALRSAALVDGSYAVIQDRITTGPNYCHMRWNVLTEAERITFLNDNTALLQKNNQVLYLRVEAPFPVKLQSWNTRPPRAYDSPNPDTQMVGFETELPLKQTSDITVYLMPGRDYPQAKGPYDFQKIQ